MKTLWVLVGLIALLTMLTIVSVQYKKEWSAAHEALNSLPAGAPISSAIETH
jgi:hypothetical protein